MTGFAGTKRMRALASPPRPERARLQASQRDRKLHVTFISYGQNLEDVMLWRALRDVEDGFYIDVGAWDPCEDSVTLAFYERGWRGINVEPDPVKHRALLAGRPRDVNLAVALSDAAGEAMFHVVPGTGLSTLDPDIAARHRAAGFDIETRPVAVTTLGAVCEEYVHGPIHLLKVDVEGFELQVLRGAEPLLNAIPTVILEVSLERFWNQPIFHEVIAQMAEWGYWVYDFVGFNRRPADGSLGQADVCFVRSDSPLRRRGGWDE